MPRDVIGTAYVRIVAMSQDFEKQVQQSFDKLKPMASQNGEDVQQAWTDGFTKKLDTSLDDGFSKARDRQRDQWAAAGPDHAGGYSDAFGQRMGNDLLDHQNATTDEMGKSWADAGQRHGGMYGDPLSTEIDRAMGRSVDNSQNLWRNSRLMRFTLEDLQSLAKDMPNILGGASDNSGRTMRQRLSGHFANIGQDLKNTFANIGQGLSATLAEIFKGGGGGGKSKMFTWMTDGADAARSALVNLITLGETLGSALIALVAALANVVSGLFALVAAAGQAAGALAVIPGLVSAVAQAGITMMVGFKGVGKAISEGMKATGDSMGGAATRAKELETAQRGVANASRAVQSAEESAARAKTNLKKAQQDLNDAYKEGAKQLRDIQYAAEDAALQEERSAINLANARDELLRVKATNPADSRAVQEAELAYKEADLAYREARSRNKDASAEANDATKKGVKGTQAVVSAQDRLISAQQAVTDSNQRLADATIALADAQKTLVDTQNGSLGSMKTYNDALKKFGPEGQKFIKTIISMQSQFRGLKQAAGEGMFRALNIELKQFATGPLFPLLKRNFALTSTAIGGVITRFSDMIQQGDNMKSLDRIMRSNIGVIGSMGAVATNLGQAFISITDAARPMTQEFAKWVDHVTAGWAATLKADNASGALTKKFQKASGVAKQLGRIFRNLWDAISGTGRAATGSGAARQMLDDLEAASKKWADWVNSVTGNEQLQAYFIRVADGFKPLMEGVNAVIKGLLLWGGNTDTIIAVGDAFQAVAKTLGWVAKQVDQVAPMFKGFSDALADIFNVLQQSGSLQGFATVMTAAAKAVAGALNWLIQLKPFGEGNSLLQRIFNGKNIIFFVGAVLGVVRALSLLSKGFRFLFRGTIGKSILTLTHGFKGLKNVLGGKSFFSGMTKSSEEARKEFQKQMLVDRLKKQALQGIGTGSDDAKKALKNLDDESKKSRKTTFGDKIKNKIGLGQKSEPVLSGGGGVLATGTSGGFVDRITKTTSAGVSKAGSAFSGVMSKFTNGLSTAGLLLGSGVTRFSTGVSKVGGVFSGAMSRFNGGLSKVGGAFGGVVGKFTGGMGKIGGAFSNAVGRFSSGVGKVGGKIGGTVSKVGGGLRGAGTRLGAVAGGVGSRVASGASRVASGASRVGTGVKRGAVGALGVAGLAIAGVTAIAKLNKDSAKALADQVGSIMKSLPEGLKQLAGQLPRMLSSIGSAIGPVIQSISESLPNILAGIGKAIPKVITGITTAFPKVVGAITKLLPTLINTLVKLLPIVINALVKLVPMLITAIAKFLPIVITTVVKLIPLVITALVKLIPIVINAIVKLLPVVIKALSIAIPAIIKGIAFALPLIIGALANAIPEIIKGVAGALPLIITGIAEAVPQIIQALAEAFPQIVQAVATALPLIWKALQDMWPGIQKGITDNVPKIIDGLGKMISTILAWIGKNGPVILGKLLEWGKAFVGWIAPRIPILLAELGKLIVKVVVWIAQQIPKIVGKLVEWAGAFIGWIGPKIPGMLLELGKFIGKILVWIVQQIPTIVAKLVEWAGAFLGWILPLLPKIPIELAKLWIKIAVWIAQQIPNIAKKIGEWGGAFLGWVGDVVSKIPSKLGEIWTKISSWIGELPGKIGKAAKGLWDGLWSGLKTGFITIINWVIGKWNGLSFDTPDFPGTDWGGQHITMPHIEPFKLATGGVVQAVSGGVSTLLGEAGHSEVVKPLDRQGLTAADRKIMEMMRAQSEQIARLVSSLTAPLAEQASQVRPLIMSTATQAAVVATQRTVSLAGASNEKSNTKVAMAIEHLTQSVDALQKPLVGGDLTVTAAPGETVVDGALPRVLRRRAYTRVGAR